MRRILALFLLTLTLTTHAQQKLTVMVTHSGDDSVGQRLAFAVREAIRGSNGYELLTGPLATFRIQIVTLDPDKNRASSGLQTVAAITYTMRNTNSFIETNPHTWYPIYLSSSVMVSGSTRVEEQAKSVLADLEAQIEEFKNDTQKK